MHDMILHDIKFLNGYWFSHYWEEGHVCEIWKHIKCKGA